MREVIDACDEPSPTVTKVEDNEDLMTWPFSDFPSNSLARKSESAPANASADCGLFDNGLTNTDNASASGASTSADSLRNNVFSISSPSSQSDKATLRELLPSASDEDLDNALLEFGGLNSAADALLEGDSLQEDSNTPECESLMQIINILGRKLTGKRKKQEVDEDDLIEDAVD